jgi:hypothetical protein
MLAQTIYLTAITLFGAVALLGHHLLLTAVWGRFQYGDGGRAMLKLQAAPCLAKAAR